MLLAQMHRSNAPPSAQSSQFDHSLEKQRDFEAKLHHFLVQGAQFPLRNFGA
jgi:hypothetical protein